METVPTDGKSGGKDKRAEKERQISVREKNLLILGYGVVYAFIHILIYSSHNFKQIIAKECMRIQEKDFGLLEMATLLRFLGSIGGSWVAQNKLRPLKVTAGMTVSFVLSLTLLILLNRGGSSGTLGRPANLALYMVGLAAESSILPTIDAECMSVLSYHGLQRKFSTIRMFSTIGHGLAYFLVYLSKSALGQERTVEAIALNTLCSGALSVIFMLVIINRTGPSASEMPEEADEDPSFSAVETDGQRREEGARFSLASLAKSLMFSFAPMYLVVLLCAIGSGLSRTSLQSYLTVYLKYKGKNNEVYLIYAYRTVIELGIWSMVIFLGDRVKNEFLFSLSIFAGALRALIYAYLPDTLPGRLHRAVPYMAETIKSAYSPLFIYASIRLAHKYARSSQKTLSQGVFTACYSGISPCLSGILAYFLLPSAEEGMAAIARLTDGISTLFLVSSIAGFASAGVSLLSYLSLAKK